MLVEKRETRYRVMWYYRLFEETQRGLTRNPNSLEHIHGSLLALGELLRHTGALSPLQWVGALPIAVISSANSRDKPANG